MVACGRVKDEMRNTPRWRFSAYGAYEARKPGDLGSGRSHGNAQANTQAGGHFLRQHPIRGQLKMPCTTNVIHGINYFVFLPVYLTGGSSFPVPHFLLFFYCYFLFFVRFFHHHAGVTVSCIWSHITTCRVVHRIEHGEFASC